MIMTGSFISMMKQLGRIHISPFNVDQLQPNGYDLRLGPEILRVVDHVLDISKPYNTYPEKPHPHHNGGILLNPGELYLGHTEEECGSDEFGTILFNRSSVARCGITVHLSAGFGEVGFKRQWTLEITVVKPTIIYTGIRICQAVFFATHGLIEDLYDGKYLDQTGPTPSLLFKDKDLITSVQKARITERFDTSETKITGPPTPSDDL